ncbi:hypothetical protein [Microbacterium sp. E-13]|uniref:hypothetical protein n=1 Tax=Microbacterium sp. E-13 TaxID=3404048 RepID=UPI003CF76543
MKRVIYAGSEFVTGDDIASALLYCSQALAEAGVAETVSVPTREQDGSIGRIMVLIGPASQIVARDVEVDGEELVDTTAVARLSAIQRRLRPVATFDSGTPDDNNWDTDL